MAPALSSISRQEKQRVSNSKSVSFAADDNVVLVPSRKRARNVTSVAEIDEEADDVYDVDVTYNESGAYAAESSKPTRQRTHAKEDDDDDDGEEDVDVNYSLLYAADKSTSTVPVEAFNLNEERSSGEGYFEGDMYVFRRRKDDEEEDAWLQSLNDQPQISSATKDGDAESSEDSDDESADRPEADKILGKAKVIREILPLLRTPKETVSDAMRRYGHISAQQAKINKLDNGDNARQCLQKLTKLANQLVMIHFENDVYDKSAEELQLWHQVLTAGTPSNKSPTQWEYYGQDNNIHGPFSTEQMLQWTKQGYFIGECAVRMRIVRKDATQEEMKAAAVHDLMADLEESDNEDSGATDRQENANEWMMSDKIDFLTYL